MKLKDVLLKVGGSVLRDVVPGAGAIIDGINAMLPDDKKLPPDVTGAQAFNTAQTLTPDQQASLFSKELDVEMAEVNAWRDIAKAHAETDATGNSTRPEIAKLMAWFYVISATPLCFGIAWSIIDNDATLLASVGNAWPLVLAILGTPIWLLRAYFGDRTEEKKARYAASVGQEVHPKGGLLSKLLK